MSLYNIISHSLPPSLGSGHTDFLLHLSTLLTSRLYPACSSPRSPVGSCHLLPEVSPPFLSEFHSLPPPYTSTPTHPIPAFLFHYNLLMHLIAYPFIVVYCLAFSSRMKYSFIRFLSLVYPKGPEQCLAHSRCSLHIG